MRYAYPCSIVRDEEEARATGRVAHIVTFPDVYGANSGAWSWDDAIDMAKDCLEVALGMYVKAREDIPVPSPMAEGQVLICVAPIVAAKLALYTAMREQNVTNVALAVPPRSTRKRGASDSRPRAPFPHHVGRKSTRRGRAHPGPAGQGGRKVLRNRRHALAIIPRPPPELFTHWRVFPPLVFAHQDVDRGIKCTGNSG